MRTATGMRSKIGASIAVAGFCAMIFTTNANAAPLGLTLNDFPDILAQFLTVEYNGGMLSVQGSAISFDDDGVGPQEFISGLGSYILMAPVATDGSLGSGGTLFISGTLPALGFNSGTLLTGDLTSFGYSDTGGSPLEFLFTVTGGDARNLFGGNGATGGSIISNGLSNFTGSFMNNWKGTDFGSVSDTAPVPLPGAGLLLLSGLGGLVATRRSRKQ